MDIDRAKQILTILSDGIHPTTGEILPDNDSSNQLDIVRAIRRRHRPPAGIER